MRTDESGSAGDQKSLVAVTCGEFEIPAFKILCRFIQDSFVHGKRVILSPTVATLYAIGSRLESQWELEPAGVYLPLPSLLRV